VRGLAEQLERFEHVAVACSFQKEESVLLDLVLEARPDARVFTIDTGVLFAETLATWRAFEEHFGVRVEPFDARPAEGTWSAERCCGTAKVAALKAALVGADCWVTGVRREQSPTRANAQELEFDEGNGLWKANPLVAWTERDVWRHIHERDLPYHPLHDAGYASIGCAPCTQPGSGREGRWAGTGKLECGIHEARLT
jgi:phosphoadenosine phosphosulfate reductase